MVIGSSRNLFSAEELYMPINFHSPGAYIHLNRLQKSAEVYTGELCSLNITNGALKLCKKLALLEDFIPNLTVKNLNNTKKVLLKPLDWVKAPRLIRVYETEGRELTSPRFIQDVNFSFRKSDLR